jgi:hypothetical protein
MALKTNCNLIRPGHSRKFVLARNYHKLKIFLEKKNEYRQT